MESMVIFLAWMMILSMVWSFSHDKVENEKEKWAREKEEAQLILWTDTLLLQHHIDPWYGCAQYSEEKRRVLPYVAERTCFIMLSKTRTPYPLSYAVVRTKKETLVLHDDSSAGKECMGVRRPFLLDGKESAVLEAGTCEK
jgi:hypothetical protein